MCEFAVRTAGRLPFYTSLEMEERRCGVAEMRSQKKKTNTFVNSGGSCHRLPNTITETDQSLLPRKYTKGADPDVIILVNRQHDVKINCESSNLD